MKLQKLIIMTKKIVYLFGAGASKNALPIVEEIPNRIDSLLILLNDVNYELSRTEKFENLQLNAPKVKYEYQRELINSLEWLKIESSRHSTVDTFAKKLTIKSDYKNLKKLKIALSVFFVFEQLKNKPDSRYDSFFASIHSSLYRFPKNIRILSWNYDSQFEISYSEYTEMKDLLHLQNSLPVRFKNGDSINSDGFCIYKLNGNLGFSTNNGWDQYHYASYTQAEINKEIVEQIVKQFTAATYFREITPNFSFAWEENKSNSSFFEQIQNEISDANILVIIGYSFPFFNRDIDRALINNMTQLEKVYFQSPEAENIVQRFEAVRADMSRIEKVLINDVKQFWLPNEL